MKPSDVSSAREALISQCKAGDRDALGSLYATYAPRMMRVVCHYVDDWQDAQDVLHDGFLVIFSRIRQLRKPECLEYWMASIMKNLALQHLREADITCLLSEDMEDMEVPEFEQSITMEQLEVMVNRLPLGYRRVFRLAVLEHKSHKEIARILGISEQTSGSQLYHARVLLRRMINEYRMQAGILVIAAVLGVGLWFLSRHDDGRPSPEAISARMQTEGLPADTATQSTRTPILQADTAVLTAPSSAFLASRIEETPLDTATLAPTIPEPAVEPPYADTLQHRMADPGEQYMVRQTDVEIPVHAEGGGFEMALSGTIVPGQQMASGWMVDGNPLLNDPGYTVEEDVRYGLPVAVEITVAKALGPRWKVGAGLRYTRHHTSRTLSYQFHNGSHVKESQSISAHYLGVPLQVSWRGASIGSFSMFATAGASLEVPLDASVRHSFTVGGTLPQTFIRPEAGRHSFHAPVLLSLTAGVSLEYKVHPMVSIHMRPTVMYTLPAHSPYPLLPTSRHWNFAIPVGLTVSPK